MTGKRSFTAFWFLMTVLAGEADLSSLRISGGNDVPKSKYSWAASIRVDGVHSCSGSIIHDYFIITAARCVSTIDTDRLSARVGSTNQFAGGHIVHVQSVFIHPSFGNFLHDIALLKMDKPFTLNSKISKISLANEDEKIAVGSEVFMTGWGAQENGSPSYKLRYLSLSVLSEEECERQAGYGYGSVICLAHFEGKGICHGDEGGGVVSGTKLIAVASFYFGNCGTKYPDVSSNTSYYNTWIKSVIEQNL